MCLDICLPAGASRAELEEAVRRTTLWAQRQRDLPRAPGQLRFAITQGGLDLELRQRSSEELVALDFDGYAIGGLSVGEHREPMFEATTTAAAFLPEEKAALLHGDRRPGGRARGDRARRRHVRLRPPDAHRAHRQRAHARGPAQPPQRAVSPATSGRSRRAARARRARASAGRTSATSSPSRRCSDCGCSACIISASCSISSPRRERRSSAANSSPGRTRRSIERRERACDRRQRAAAAAAASSSSSSSRSCALADRHPAAAEAAEPAAGHASTSCAVGDEVLTAGGSTARCRGIDDDEVRVEIAPKIEVRLARRAIAGSPASTRKTRPASRGGRRRGRATRSWQSAFDEDDPARLATHRTRRSPANLSRSEGSFVRERRNYLLLMGADRGRRRRRRCSSPFPARPLQEADAGPRPAGWPRGDPQGGAEHGADDRPGADADRAADHGQPRRQARRRLAERRAPGQRTRSSSSSPASTIRRRRRRSSARPASCSSSTSRRISPPPTVNGSATRRRTRRSTRLLTAGEGRGEEGHARGVLPLRPEDEGHASDRSRARRRRRRRRSRTPSSPGRTRRRKQLLAAYGGHKPAGTTILAVPAHREVVSGPTANFTARRSRSRRLRTGATGTSSSTTRDGPDGPPEISGNDLNESNISAGIDQNTNAAAGHARLHGPRREGVPGDHEGRVRPRPARRRAPRLGRRRSTSRTRSTTRSSSTASSRRRRTSTTPTTRSRSASRAATAVISNMGIDRTRRTTSPSSSRAVRCRTRSSGSRRHEVSATLGKSSLHQAILAAIAGLAHRRALPARALPLPRSRRGARPRDLRGSSTTRRSSSSTSR